MNLARPHLEAALQSDKPKIAIGAATGLLIGGDKTVMPQIFGSKGWSELNWLDFEDLQAALEKTTGLALKSPTQWKKWWDETGSKMEWK